ncbi:MAG: penicillin-binding protein, partial [Bdellovibrionales bacterium]|nr:penicillin-binding protein [Bdellovibrionales bacterium]
MKGFFIKLSIVILLLMTLSLGIGVGIYSHFTSQLPQIESLADYSPSIPSKIFSKDGRLLAEIGREKREVIEISSLPQVVIDSFLAAEDDSFYEHRGVDYTGLMRAFWVNLKAGRVVQGGSTITQQVAKSLLLTRERSLSRKIKDFLLAQKIEERFTKEEILFLYL